MRVQVMLGTFLASLAGLSAAQTRAQEDSASLLRRCEVPRSADETGDQYAIRCAEHFIAEQGYTANPPTRDTNRVVPEGIEWKPSRAEWLAYRRRSLEPHAVGVCTAPETGRYTVVFRSSGGRGARGVTLDATLG